MSVTEAFKAVNRDSFKTMWQESKHYAKVTAVALTIGTAFQLGLPTITLEADVLTLQLDPERLLGAAILIIGLMNLSGWIRSENGRH